MRDQILFTLPDKPISCPDNAIREFGKDMLVSLIFLRTRLPAEEQKLFLHQNGRSIDSLEKKDPGDLLEMDIFELPVMMTLNL
ncbi:MAG: hypothetical protein KJ737_17415 [Proteobacteria bacterium]|nr:hypothetical protein [Pseudomonadota bacterium]